MGVKNKLDLKKKKIHELESGGELNSVSLLMCVFSFLFETQITHEKSTIAVNTYSGTYIYSPL